MERDLQNLSEAAGQAAGEGGSLVSQAEQAVEEVVEEAGRCIGHYPFSAVAAALGGGVLIGWLIGRSAIPPSGVETGARGGASGKRGGKK